MSGADGEGLVGCDPPCSSWGVGAVGMDPEVSYPSRAVLDSMAGKGMGEGVADQPPVADGGVVERWLAALASTEPADRERAEHGVACTYRANGRSMPDLLVWFDSPLAGALAAHLLDAAGVLGGARLKPLGKRLCRQINEVQWHSGPLKRSFDRDLASNADLDWDAVDDSLWRPIDPDRWRSTWTVVWSALSRGIEGHSDEGRRKRLLGGLQRLGAEGWRRDDLVAGGVLFSFRLAPSASFSEGGGAVTLPFEPCFAADDAATLALFDYLIQQGSPTPVAAGGLIDVALNAGWWWPFDHAVVMTERPCARSWDTAEVADGDPPLLVYPDGWRCWRTPRSSHGYPRTAFTAWLRMMGWTTTKKR